MRSGVVDLVFAMKGYQTQHHKVELGAGETVILHVELYPKK